MADIHDLILIHGKNHARKALGAERKLADIAAAVMADEDARLGFTHSGFCLTALPHRDISANRWRRDGHRITLWIAGGEDRQGTPIGVPYGSTARMILLYLQTRACRPTTAGWNSAGR